MDIYSSAVENYQSKGSVYDSLDAAPHVDDYEFHILQESNRCASAVMQGFAKFMYKEKTGEPDIPYTMMHKTLTPFELKVFLQAFGYQLSDLPDDVPALWALVTALFEPKKSAAKTSTKKAE